MSRNPVSPPALNDLLEILDSKLKAAVVPICSYLVKTAKSKVDVRGDYATFSLDNGLLAAMYPSKSGVDLLLALPMDAEDKLLFDSVDKDYKWRNLPVGVSVESPRTADEALERLKLAKKLVASGVIQELDGDAFARPKEAFQPAFKKKYRYR